MNAKNLAGYLISLLAGAAIVYFLMKPGTKTEASGPEKDFNSADVTDLPPLGKKVSGTIGKDTADSMVRNYRNYAAIFKKTDLIWHNQDTLKYFMDSIFIKYTAKIAPPEGYVWRLAITPMFVNEKSQTRLSVCLLPCLVDKTDPKKGYDFFVEMRKNSTIYKDYFLKLYNSVASAGGLKKDSDEDDDTIIFDEGQLWP